MNIRREIAKIVYPEIFAVLETAVNKKDILIDEVDELVEMNSELIDENELLQEQLMGLQNELRSAHDTIEGWEPDVTDMQDVFDERKPTQSDKPSASSVVTPAQAVIISSRTAGLTGTTWMKVANTNSMEPHIDANMVIGLIEVRPEDIKENDIIGYNGNYARWRNFKGKKVLHRVKKISADGKKWLMQGDNNFTHDGWIPHDALIGQLWNVIIHEKSNLND